MVFVINIVYFLKIIFGFKNQLKRLNFLTVLEIKEYIPEKNI